MEANGGAPQPATHGGAPQLATVGASQEHYVFSSDEKIENERRSTTPTSTSTTKTGTDRCSDG